MFARRKNRSMSDRTTFQARPPLIETLEQRRLLSVSLDNGVLTVVGSKKADVITCSLDSTGTMLHLSENGAASDFPLDQVTGINISGGNGNDIVTLDPAVTLPGTLDGGNGSDQLFGGSGDDLMDGGNGKDILHGGAGNDTESGGNANDTVDGEAGDDSLDGGNGKDLLDGGDGNDDCHGGAGNDRIAGGVGNDALHGEAGKDDLTGDDGDDAMDGGTGNDLLDGGVGNDNLVGGVGKDHCRGGQGDDQFDDNSDGAKEIEDRGPDDTRGHGNEPGDNSGGGNSGGPGGLDQSPQPGDDRGGK